ncbi:MAG TPA: DUF4231 domain-containing protein [Thiobacillus sp.]|nr:DUF4231 domain-containing protein [Thiobacillus sp.]
MDEAEYLKTRLDGQIGWYDKKSQCHQKWYKGLRIVEIVAAVSIPFLTGYMTATEPLCRTVVGLFGVLIAVIAAVLSLCQFQENWIEYRTTCESLKHEKFRFLTKTQPYDVDTPFPLLVQRVESMISKENTAWSQYIRPQKKEPNHG